MPRVVDSGRLTQAAKLHGELAQVRVPAEMPVARDVFVVLVVLFAVARSTSVWVICCPQMLEEDSQWAEAIKQYQSSADYYTAENAPTTALKALAKVAELSAKVSVQPRPPALFPACLLHTAWRIQARCTLQVDPPDYATAAETYEKCATESLPSNLLKFNVKNYLFNALLCTLAGGDIVAADRDLGRYKEIDYTFPGARPRVPFLRHCWC